MGGRPKEERTWICTKSTGQLYVFSFEQTKHVQRYPLDCFINVFKAGSGGVAACLRTDMWPDSGLGRERDSWDDSLRTWLGGYRDSPWED